MRLAILSLAFILISLSLFPVLEHATDEGDSILASGETKGWTFSTDRIIIEVCGVPSMGAGGRP